MSTQLETPDRIADAALVLVARRGLRKLSMTDIGEAANVSRGTLYRYFASQKEVLAALEERLLQTLQEKIEDAITARPATTERAKVVLDALIAYRESFPALGELAQTQPVLMLDFFTRRFDALLELLTTHLQPALNQTHAVNTGAMTEEQLAEVLLRLAMTADLVAPGADFPGTGAAALWMSLLAPRNGARTATGSPRRPAVLRKAS